MDAALSAAIPNCYMTVGHAVAPAIAAYCLEDYYLESAVAALSLLPVFAW